MRRQRICSLFLIIALFVSFLAPTLAGADAPAPADAAHGLVSSGAQPLDLADAGAFARNRGRLRLLEDGRRLEAQSLALALAGEDRALVILVEFGGTDTFTWQPGDRWDPLGRADPREAVYNADANVAVGDCSKIITQTRSFTYTGPRHNEIPRPLSAADVSGDSIWTPDFSRGWFEAMLFGNGVRFDYTREDGSAVSEDFTGQSVADYFLDLSGGVQRLSGDVIGWVTLPHSAQWYGADACPGRRSGAPNAAPTAGGISGAGDERSFAVDTLRAVDALSNTIPGFAWQNYDRDGDGVIDRLWLVHAGYGEDEDATLLNRTAYGEGALWSRPGALTPPVQVAPGVTAGSYIMLPENGGIAALAREYAHSLGAMDLRAQGGGDPSVGFWSLMGDDEAGYPAGFEPPALDPLHLDGWGWLEPLVINDPSREYVFRLGQASRFGSGENTYRAARIELPDEGRNLPVPVWQGARYWWGGGEELANARMTTRTPALIPPAGARLSFDAAYGLRAGVDFLWAQASPDGETWTTLTNANTTCAHAADWIGAARGFPDDLCAAGLGGLTGYNAHFPAPDAQEFDLSAFAGTRIYLRLWHMTGRGAPREGPFVDNIRVAGDTVVFVDDAEGPGERWEYDAPWTASHGARAFSQNYYLQWRNVSASGGYDSALGDARSRLGPANTGLLVWLNNNYYADNEIDRYLRDYPSFGPKGKLLVVDAHPVPYRDPGVLAAGFPNEGANLPGRGEMRDAPFSLKPTAAIRYPGALPGSAEWVSYAGRPAVSAFHDAFGYYPGAEMVSRGPAHSAHLPKWITRQWDASAVVPARAAYALRAPGMRADAPLLYRCHANLDGARAGMLDCYTYQFALGYEGGSGNPGDALGQYGWHVEVLEQSDSGARVRVWNALKDFAGVVTTTPDAAPAIKGSTLRVDIQTTNIGSAADALFIAPLDERERYAPGSAYGGAYPLTAAAARELPGEVAAAALAGAPNRGDSDVVAVAMSARLATAGAARFGFSTEITAERGEINRPVAVFEGGTRLTAFEANPLPITPTQQVTEDFRAVADAHISRGIPRANFGQWPFMYIGGNDVLRSLVRFDLTGIDRRFPVDHATLSLYVGAFGGGGSPASLSACPLMTDWQEAAAMWQTPWTVAGGDYDAALAGKAAMTKANVGKWIQVNVTAMARKWVADPTSNYGALLRLTDATSFTTYRFVTKDNGWQRAYAPKLRVTYRKP